jgi:hypothetical protein
MERLLRGIRTYAGHGIVTNALLLAVLIMLVVNTNRTERVQREVSMLSTWGVNLSGPVRVSPAPGAVFRVEER